MGTSSGYRRNMMKTFVILSLFLVFLFSSNAEICKNDAGDENSGGACYHTSHTLTRPINSEDTFWETEGEIKEYHFHTYWFQHNPDSYAAALRIQNELINAVAEGQFVAVLPGITKDVLPEINEDDIPHVETEPFGPHPCGSFETWVPKEYLTEAMSFFYAKTRRAFDIHSSPDTMGKRRSCRQEY